jgi:hypothetical protein
VSEVCSVFPNSNIFPIKAFINGNEKKSHFMESDISEVFMFHQSDLVLKSSFGHGQISYEASSSIVCTTLYPEISVQ